MTSEGWEGWDEYAAFYDWENARTLGRRDVAFWRRIVRREAAPVLELGCGTGRLLMPAARLGFPAAGLDRSRPMLARAFARARRLPPALRPALVRGDVRLLPFRRASFGVVMAAYGILQSLLADADVESALSEAARVLRRKGLFGIDLVPDLPRWVEYERRVRLRGPSPEGGRVTLVETVRQDRRRRVTVFDEEFIERRGGRETRRRFQLRFRTLALDAVVQRLAKAGFRVEDVLGDYGGGPWTPKSETWLILARRK